MAKTNNLVSIGRVSAPHGVKGELRIVPMTDFPGRFEGMREMSLYKGDICVFNGDVTFLRWHESKGSLLVSLAGVEDRSAAEKLRGCLVRIPLSQRVPLPEGAFWIDDIIGFNVFAGERFIGVLSDVLRTGSNDIYEVKKPEGGVLMIPAISQVVKDIDIARGKIQIELLEGLE